MRSLLALLILLPAIAHGQTEPVRVSLDARGEDVREVFATLFAQAHKPYALDATIKGRLYVTLDRMPYAKALGVVLTQAGLVAKERDGVVMVSPAPKPVAAPKPTATPMLGPPTPSSDVKKATPPSPVVRPVPPSAFARKVTTRLTRAPLADVFAALADQAEVDISVDPTVPPYRVDAFFVKTSLRYALDRVCKAAGLKYAVAGGKIVVSRP